MKSVIGFGIFLVLSIEAKGTTVSTKTTNTPSANATANGQATPNTPPHPGTTIVTPDHTKPIVLTTLDANHSGSSASNSSVTVNAHNATSKVTHKPVEGDEEEDGEEEFDENFEDFEGTDEDFFDDEF